MRYRKEIDGLRAVAVVPVVLFHAGVEGFSGGFVGVDVFFVISGYLITALILSERTAGRFSIVNFYERRARRILPALFAIMLACIPFAWFWMTPSQLEDFGEGIGTVSLFSSNALFFFHSGYFAPAAAENPLLHTWSLAVEEQFYLFFPLFLALCLRFGRSFLTIGIASVALASFAFAHLGGSFNVHFPFIDKDWAFVPTSFAFYLTPARAWELMIGALIAIKIPSPHARFRWLSEIGGAAGLAAIVFSITLFTKSTPFPSIYTLVPDLGAALIIIFVTPETLVGRLLSSPPLVGIGLISYSLYLWHVPLLAFIRIHSTTAPDAWVLGLLVALSFGLAYLSWRYVERPFRDRARTSRPQIFALAGIGSAAFICAGSYLTLTHGALDRFPPKDRYLVSFDPAAGGQYVSARFNQLDRDFAPGPGKKIVIIGDSYAKDLVNMIFETGQLAGYQIVTRDVPASCQIVFPEPDTAFCRGSSLMSEVAQARIRQADVVILSASWTADSAARLKTTLSAIGIGRHQKLFIVGTKKFGLIRPLSYLPLTHEQRIAMRNQIPDLEANDILRASFPPSVFIDIERIVCGAGSSCPVFTPTERLISFDGSHLTPDGARFVGQLLFERSSLRTLRAQTVAGLDQSAENQQ